MNLVLTFRFLRLLCMSVCLVCAFNITLLRANTPDANPTPKTLKQWLRQAYQAQQRGDVVRAAQQLQQVAKYLQPEQTALQILLAIQRSDLARVQGEDLQANTYAEQAAAQLNDKLDAEIRALALNNLGNMRHVEAYYSQANQYYRQALTLAQQAKKPLLSAKILHNLAQTAFAQANWDEATRLLKKAQTLLLVQSVSAGELFQLLGLGQLALRVYTDPESSHNHNADLRQLAYHNLQQALEQATQAKLPLLQSYANGYLGQLYEYEQRFDDALQLSRRALFFAQQVQAKEVLYRWQWQIGRLYARQAQLDAAINAYRQAIIELQPIRDLLSQGQYPQRGTFRERVGAVYFELADLLLQRARNEVDADAQAWLIEARDTIERLKTIELQNYFRDDCVIERAADLETLTRQLNHTAVIYPIILPDRVAILVTIGAHLYRFGIPVPAQYLQDEVNEFRVELETYQTDAYLDYAQRLHNWLIRPLQKLLQTQHIDTLVIVPDAVLRTIPFAALHDGKQFLIQQYALATIPSLRLTHLDTSHPPTEPMILLSGLSKAVQAFPALHQVRHEIATLQALYPREQTQILLDEAFTVHNFTAQLRSSRYSIVHIASHGQFSSDPKYTFLLAYDDKLHMKQLENLLHLNELRNDPVDLLSLSACQTAVGDDLAALGLAGVALQAGTRSALASLWAIDDAATQQLISQFYRHWYRGGESKAQALQRAQQHLLQQWRYQHPAYWAAFLLIGNWR